MSSRRLALARPGLLRAVEDCNFWRAALAASLEVDFRPEWEGGTPGFREMRTFFRNCGDAGALYLAACAARGELPVAKPAPADTGDRLLDEVALRGRMLELE